MNYFHIRDYFDFIAHELEQFTERMSRSVTILILTYFCFTLL